MHTLTVSAELEPCAIGLRALLALVELQLRQRHHRLVLGVRAAHVPQQLVLPLEARRAQLARVRPLVRVRVHVANQLVAATERIETDVAGVRTLAGVRAGVARQVRLGGERFAAGGAAVRPEAAVQRQHVLHQVRAAAELLLANAAAVLCRVATYIDGRCHITSGMTVGHMLLHVGDIAEPLQTLVAVLLRVVGGCRMLREMSPLMGRVGKRLATQATKVAAFGVVAPVND